MTPAEQLVMALESPVLDGLDGHERLVVAIEGMGDKRYGYLSSGERAVMRMAARLDAIAFDLPAVDEEWQERIGDALARTAATAWGLSDSAALQHRYIIDEGGAA